MHWNETLALTDIPNVYRGLSWFRTEGKIMASKLNKKLFIENNFAAQLINGFSTTVEQCKGNGKVLPVQIWESRKFDKTVLVGSYQENHCSTTNGAVRS